MYITNILLICFQIYIKAFLLTRTSTAADFTAVTEGNNFILKTAAQEM